MSKAQLDRKIENLIQEYRELIGSWNGESLVTEEKIHEMACELEDYGINIDDLED